MIEWYKSYLVWAITFLATIATILGGILCLL